MNLVSKGNVKHDGKWYEDGDKISQLKKEDGQRLIDLGIAYEAGTEEAPEAPSPLTEGDEDENLSFAELEDEDEDEEDEDEEDEDEEEEEVKPLTKAQIRAANRKKNNQ